MVSALFTNPFLFYALIAGCAASITSGMIGSYVVIRRIVFISGSIAHLFWEHGHLSMASQMLSDEWLTPTRALAAGILSALFMGGSI